MRLILYFNYAIAESYQVAIDAL